MNKRLLGLVVGAAAMALTQMTPAQAAGGGGTRTYVAGGWSAGGGVVLNTNSLNPAAPSLGGVMFDNVSGTSAKFTIADASAKPVGAVVSFTTSTNAAVGGLNYICGVASGTFAFPAGATRAWVYLGTAWVNSPVTPNDCGTAPKTNPATTGTVNLVMT